MKLPKKKKKRAGNEIAMLPLTMTLHLFFASKKRENMGANVCSRSESCWSIAWPLDHLLYSFDLRLVFPFDVIDGMTQL